MTNIPQWLVNEVADGLAALMALRLRNAPAEDTIELTADIWEQAFMRRLGVAVEPLDAPRIAEGFRRIFPTVTEWPAPAQVMGLMPGRPPQKQLPAPEPTTEEHRENVTKIKTMVNELMDKLYLKNKAKEQGK